MILPIMLLLQSSGQPAPVVPSAVDRQQTCDAAADPSDIVVCAPANQEEFRLRPLPPRYGKEQKGPGAEINLGHGARANAYAAQQKSPDGRPDKRILVTVTLPF